MRPAALLMAALLGASAPPPGIVRRPPGEIEFTAIVNTRGFEKGGSMAGYHAVVWKEGRAAGQALLVSDVSDRQVLDALESLGARPGAGLPMEAWESRKDPASRAPDTAAAGPPVEILLRLPGRPDLVSLAAVLSDSSARGIDMRFAGNRENIPVWKSGCVACLYSCPGSKVGNSRYTVRDFTRKATRFAVRPAALPPDGTRVGVVLRVRAH